MSATLDASWWAGGIPPIVGVGRRGAELVLDLFLVLLEQLFHLLAFLGEILTIFCAFAAWSTAHLRLNRPFYLQLFGARVVRPLRRRPPILTTEERLRLPGADSYLLGYDVAVQTVAPVRFDVGVQADGIFCADLAPPLPLNRTPIPSGSVVAPSDVTPLEVTIGSVSSPYAPDSLPHLPRPSRANAGRTVGTAVVPENADGSGERVSAVATARRSRRSSSRLSATYHE